MARGRLLSTEASVDPELNSLSTNSMLLYLLTLPHLDRDGLIDAHPMRLAAVAAPLQPNLRDQAGGHINEWVDAGLVVRYEIGRGRACLFFKGFRKHQQGMEYGREPASKYPPPPGWVRTKAGLIPEDSESCFQLAEAFHGKSTYRAALLAAAGADVPASMVDDDEPELMGDDAECLPDTSRSVREGSRSSRDDFAPKTNKDKRTVFGVGGVQTNTPPTPGYGKGGDARGGAPTPLAPTRLTQALAEYDDDELRIGADAAGQINGMHEEFNGWARLLAGATRADLLLILAWCTRWRYSSLEEQEQIQSYPALLRSKLKTGEWPGLAGSHIDACANLVEDALCATAEYAAPRQT